MFTLPCENSLKSTINIARRTVILDVDVFMYIYVKMVLMLFMCTVHLRAKTQSIVANMRCSALKVEKCTLLAARAVVRTYAIMIFERRAVQIKVLLFKIMD